MGKFKKSESGFGVVGILLVVVIIVLISSVGWLVYKNHNKVTKTITNTKTATMTTAQNPFAGWKTYTNSTYGLSFKYPSQWSVYSQPSGGDLNLYVSETTPSELQKTTTSPVQDDNFLEVSIYISNNSVSNSVNNAGVSNLINLGSITYNSKSYSLIGETSSTGETNNGSVVLVGVDDCPSGLTSCGEFLPTSKGGSIVVSTYAAVIGQLPTIPIDLKGSQYQDALQIFKSMTF